MQYPRLGDINAFGADPRRVATAGHDVDGAELIDFGKKYGDQNNAFTARFDSLGSKFNGKSLDDYINGKSFCCSGKNLDEIEQNETNSAENAKLEDNLYFYHPDHLGSTNLITNFDGEVTQSVAYIPYGEVFVEERNGSWATPFLFNAKELDEETGLYYYGARYLDPTDCRWLAVDPVFHPGSSPYAYCLNNPIKLVDPDGRDEYEVNPQGYISKVKECEKHVLYAVDKDGSRTGKSINVKNASILDDLIKERNDYNSKDNQGKSPKKGNYAVTKSSESLKLFTFLSDASSEAEWEISKYKDGNYLLKTGHQPNAVSSFHAGETEMNLTFDIHSHPGYGVEGTKGGSGSITPLLSGDMLYINEFWGRWYAHYRNDCDKQRAFPHHYVYHRKSKGLYQYTPWKQSINLGVVKNYNILINMGNRKYSLLQ